MPVCMNGNVTSTGQGNMILAKRNRKFAKSLISAWQSRNIRIIICCFTLLTRYTL